jgi:maltose-binding protein MalE
MKIQIPFFSKYDILFYRKQLVRLVTKSVTEVKENIKNVDRGSYNELAYNL